MRPEMGRRQCEQRAPALRTDAGVQWEREPEAEFEVEDEVVPRGKGVVADFLGVGRGRVEDEDEVEGSLTLIVGIAGALLVVIFGIGLGRGRVDPDPEVGASLTLIVGIGGLTEIDGALTLILGTG